MLDLKDLIFNIPEGKKRKYLGNLLVDSLTSFYENYEIKEIDIDELIIKNIDSILLKDEIFNDLRLFSFDSLKKIFNNDEELIPKTIKKLREEICSYYELNFSIEPTLRLSFENKTDCIITLHDFQDRIRRKVINLIFNNEKRFLIHMPTGSGKTRTAAEIMLDFFRFSSANALLSNKIKVLWVAQSSELCHQAYNTVKFIFDNKATTNVCFGHFYENLDLEPEIFEENSIIFCSIQKLLLHYTNDDWRKIKNETYLVIVDEAHRSVASQWNRALDFFVANPSVYLLGLTATPGIGKKDNVDNYLLSTYYNNNKISITDEKYSEIKKPINFLIEKGFLAEIERIDIDSNNYINDSDFSLLDGEFKFKESTLNKLASNPSRNLSIINIIRKVYSENKKVLVFTCGIEHNKILKSILFDYKIEAEVVDANSKNRNRIIDDFKNGNLNVLLNFGVLTTGFDAPKTDVCIIARPINSIVMYSQMVGRILRGELNNGNKKNTLYTIKDNLSHGDYDDLFKSFNEFYI
jgi:DNA repair protein RadD